MTRVDEAQSPDGTESLGPSWRTTRLSALEIRVARAWQLSTVGWFLMASDSILLVGIEIRPIQLETGMRTEIIHKTLTLQRAATAVVTARAEIIYVPSHPGVSLALLTLKRALDGDSRFRNILPPTVGSKIARLSIRHMPISVVDESLKLFGADRLSVVCVECGSVRFFPSLVDGVCPGSCFDRMSERGTRALQKARQAHRAKETRLRVPKDPDWGGMSVHTLPGPGPTQ
jgi:hypothetical protein